MLSNPISRRYLMCAGVVAGGAAGASAQKATAMTTTAAGEHDGSASNPGPDDEGLKKISPNSYMPPATDHVSVPQFWQSFTHAHRRIQEGGWTRQVNVMDFPISRDLAGVNMKLNAGGIRELHWHTADEWALMLTGTARITALDHVGDPYVKDVKAGDLWYFPQGLPHSIQGLGPDGCEFLLVFDQGSFSEDDTTLLSDWLIHTPREVVAKNFGVAASALDGFATIPPDGRYIFQAPVPPPLEDDLDVMTKAHPPTREKFDFAMLEMKPTKENESGSVRIVDSSVFKASRNIAMAHVVVKPGAMRELHWHPNVDEWQYYIAGSGRMTLFKNHSDSRTMDFFAGDVGYVPATLPHYIENTGADDLVFLEMFKTSTYQDVSLNNWLRALPRELVRQHLNLGDEAIAAIPCDNVAVVPIRKG